MLRVKVAMKFTELKNRVSILSFLLAGFIPVFFAACDAQIKDAGGGNQPQANPPRLANLSIQSLEGGDPLTFTKQFNSETLSYSVPAPTDIKPVRINAVVAAGNIGSYAVSILPGRDITPLAGTVAVVTVLDKQSGLKENYVITFVSAELSPAAISDILLSTGSLATKITEDEYTYTVNVPAGTPDVMVVPVGAQPNTYFTYDEGANPVVVLAPDGTGSVVIGVMAQNYSPSSYTLNFEASAPTGANFSSLLGITLSSGALEAPFVSEPEEGQIQKINIPQAVDDITVNAVKSLWSDAVYFDTAPDAFNAKRFVSFPNGQTFTIRVSRGGDYTDREYKFSLNRVAMPEAKLSGLSFSGPNVSEYVFKRDSLLGSDSGTGFDPEKSEYNLKYTLGTATISAQADGEDFTISVAEHSGSTATISDGGKTAVIAVNLAPNLPPVEITVSGAGHTPKTYYVYFVSMERPTAYLQSLAVIVGSIGGVQSCSPSLETVSTDTSQRQINLYANTNTVIAHGTAQNGFVVSYNPANGYLYNDINNQTIEITVSGGPGYVSSTYKLFFAVSSTQQNPHLSSLSINGNNIHSADQLVYEYAFEYDEASALSFIFAWTYNSSEVNHVSFSENSGGSWSSNFASPPIISLGPLESAVILIKVRTIDGNEAVYYVTVRRKSAFKLTALQIQDGSTGGNLFETASSFSPAVSYYPITVPNAAASVNITAAATPGSTVSALLNGSPYTHGVDIPLQVCEPVTVILSVSRQNQITASYTFVITRERPAGFYIGANTTPICAVPAEPPVISFQGTEPEQAPPAGPDESTVPQPLPIETLAGALAWLVSNAQNDTAYTLILAGPEDSPPVVLDGETFRDQDNITFTLGALNTDTVVSLTETGSLFTVGSGVHFIIDRNIHLNGIEDNDSGSVVYLNENNTWKHRPTLEMKEGSKISGNILRVNDYGGGITVGPNSTFTMRGGTISDNHAISGGGGILSNSTGSVKIYGGLIRANITAGDGGGICAAHTLQMYGGRIQSNTASTGGGLSITTGGTADIAGGIIEYNNAAYDGGNGGGGIFIATGGVVNFSGGTIADNLTASTLKPGSPNVSGADRFNNTSGQIISGVD